jgi:hypothetical protein
MLLSKIRTDSSKNNTQQRIANTAIALGVGVISLTASIAPAFAARTGIDFDRYCKSQYQRNGMMAWTQLNGRTVYDWSCAQRQPNGRVQQFGINVGHACAVQQNTWRHGFTNFNNPYSWFCQR